MKDPAAEIATRQHGAVSRAQLREAGVSDGAINRRIASRRLHPVHRGVYLVGHLARAPLAAEAAALLACGPGSVLSHRTAGWFWHLLAERPARVEVTVAGRARAERPGIRLHRIADLPREQVRIREGMAVTSPARTLLDLAAVLTPRALAIAFDRARDERAVSMSEIGSLLERYRGRRGTKRLRASTRPRPSRR